MADPSSSIPKQALLLGLGGLIPFVGLAGVLVLAPAAAPPNALAILAAYAAIILSFMAGVHWGLALNGAAGTSYFASVIPAIWAWGALAFFGAREALLLTAAGFLALLVYDLTVIRAGGAPRWYRRLRIGLTGVVLISIAAASATAS